MGAALVRVAASVLAAVVVSAPAAVSAQPGTRTNASPHTQRVVVRPVDAHGHAVGSWKVKRLHGSPVECAGPARAAVSGNIVECFPSAYYLPSCWKSHHHTVLCLRDAREHQLVRVRYSGRVRPVVRPKVPSPQDLDLIHGQRCDIRVGGAWGTLPSHPKWVGFYSCAHGSVYGPASGDGVNREHPRWRVHLWLSRTHDTVVTRPVRTAYFVGTAH
ncbi:MAG TPA: hypothetical protein VFJ19_18000 [Nocardioidaceae bacterium]|nr:hypothetical protein [Nocardioidaceae bacterium]